MSTSRRKDFKAGVAQDDSRRRRVESALSLRKNQREEQLQKRRNLTSETVDASQVIGQADAPLLSLHSEEQVNMMLAAINSEDPNAQLQATTAIRKLLSIEKNPPIEEMIQLGVVPRLISFLRSEEHPKLQFEAAWAVTNIASGNAHQTRFIAQQGAVPIFVTLLGSPDDEVREQSVWALGNIAGDCPEMRDYVLSQNVMPGLVALLSSNTRTSLLRNTTWAISNLCRGKPQPDFAQVKQAIVPLSFCLTLNDDEMLTDACWAFSYLSDGEDSKIGEVLAAGVGARLVDLLEHSSSSVQVPALRSVGNVVTGSNEQTQHILDLQALPRLAKLLRSGKKAIKKEACWAVSNITAGTVRQIAAVVEADLLPALVDCLSGGTFEVRKEACWAVSNLTSGGTPQQIKSLVDAGAIKPLCDMLDCREDRMVQVALEALENILKSGEPSKQMDDLSPYANLIEAAGGLAKIETLQDHKIIEIYERAVKVLETHFGAEEDEDSENVTPNGQNNQSFSFHAQAPAPLARAFAF